MLPTVFWLPLKRLLELSMYLTVLCIRLIGCSISVLLCGYRSVAWTYINFLRFIIFGKKVLQLFRHEGYYSCGATRKPSFQRAKANHHLLLLIVEA